MAGTTSLVYWDDGAPYIAEGGSAAALGYWSDGLPAPAVDVVTYGYLRPSATDLAGGWKDQTGGTALSGSLDEATRDDADYIYYELGSGAPEVITQTGSVLTLPITNNANAGTVSTTITVPADAELILVGASSFVGTASALTAMTFTKGGVDTAMTKASGTGDANSTTWEGALFYLVSPDTGTNKTLKWDWVGAGVSAEPSQLFSITFWKGIDTASPVRDSDGAQSTGSTPYTTPTLTAQTGDKIVAWVAMFNAGGSGGEASINSWSNLTLLANLTHNVWADAAWATGDPTGNVAVAASSDTSADDGAISAVVLQPASTSSSPLCRVDLASASEIDGDEDVHVKYAMGVNMAGVADVTVRLLQNATVIAAWAHEGIDDETIVYAQTLTVAQRAAVDWDDQAGLKLEFEAGLGDDPTYQASAVHFAANTNILVRASVTEADAYTFSFSGWFFIPTAHAGTTQTWIVLDDSGAHSYIEYGFSGSGFLDINLRHSLGNTLEVIVYVSTNVWHHLLVSADLNHAAGAKLYSIYVDDVKYVPDPIDVFDADPAFQLENSGKQFKIGSSPSSILGDQADVWLSSTSLLVDGDIPTESRRLFIDMYGNPADPSGFPTGYCKFSGNSAAFGTNQGTGGAFSLTGSLTDATTSPSD